MSTVESTRILIVGATGMLGHAMFRYLSQDPSFEVHGTARGAGAMRLLPEVLHRRLMLGIDADNPDTLLLAFARVRPHVVINCVGLVKQLADAKDPLAALPVNSILPHRLSRMCRVGGARLVHVSTDCVFSGARGLYREADAPDATDLYGRSKLLGEVTDDEHSITLRTSIIGHELAGSHGLVSWFLSQSGRVKGYRRAVFSGLPTIELARVVKDHVIPRPELHGLYHVAAAPIDKYDLLQQLKAQYRKDIEIVEDCDVVVDRSLDSTRFRQVTGYQPAPWPELVARMHDFH